MFKSLKNIIFIKNVELWTEVKLFVIALMYQEAK